MGGLRLDGITPRIAVPFRDGTPQERIAEARRLGMDIAELRIDLFSSRSADAVSAEIGRFQDVPILATIRSAAEGGDWNGDDDERLALYKAVLPQVAAVDVELSSSTIAHAVVKAAHELERCAIVSFHDFERTPSAAELDDLANRVHNAGADIVKVAALCRTPEDLLTLAEFTLRHREKGLVTIGMGDVGLLSRVFFPALGSLLTFASFGEGTAAGQIPLEETATYLRCFYPSRAARAGG
jgi:3-dehydroquinate dehydratase-1